MINLYTPCTGFPDLEAKISYGLARVAVEAGYNPKIIPRLGFYEIKIDDAEDLSKMNRTFRFLARRLFSSSYIPTNTPGITGRSAKTITISPNDNLDLIIFQTLTNKAEHKPSEPFCRHTEKSRVSSVLGFTAFATTGVLCKRDGVDTTFYQEQIRRPTNPREICKSCALIALLGTWYSSFVFHISDKEIIVIPLPKKEISKYELQIIFATQHLIRNQWLNQDIPQILIPLIFLSKIPSTAEFLKGFDLFIAILSRQQGVPCRWSVST